MPHKQPTEFVEAEMLRLGVPIDRRFDDCVRNRAAYFAKKNPQKYVLEEDILWVHTTDQRLFGLVYRWILKKEDIHLLDRFTALFL